MLRTVILLAVLEGLTVWATMIGRLLSAPGPSVLPVRPSSLLFGVLTLGVTIGLAWATAKAYRDRSWLERVSGWMQRLAAQERNLRLAVAAFYASVLVTVTALFGLSLRMNTDLASVLAAIPERGIPTLIWLSLIVLQGGWLLHALAGKSILQTAKTFGAGALAACLLLAYWYGAEGQLLYFNVDMGMTDQSAYMEYARLLKDSGYAYPGDFNRMPLYPFLLSLVLRPGMEDPQFFLSAKYFNLFLSMLLLGALAALIFRRMDRLSAVNLVLIVAFTVFIYKAGWVQAELLFYVLNTGLFLLLWRLLQRPDVRTAVGAGVVAGAAHMTKASLWPGLLAFVVAVILQAGFAMLRKAPGTDPLPIQRGAAKSILLAALAGAAFLSVLAPYLVMSRRITGRYFYNVNSTFYVWYDSWEEAVAGTKAHGDRVGWPVMPASEVPSFAKYLREHTVGQMVGRVVSGAQEVMGRVLDSSGYFDYALAYGVLLSVAAAARWRKTRRLLSENAFLVFFLLCYFSIYVLLYFWYAPIAAGDRLILALFLPLLLTLSAGLRAVLRGEQVRIRGRALAWLAVVNVLILVMIATDIVWALQQGVYVFRGGG